MKTQFFGAGSAVILIILAILAYTSLYTVSQTDFALPLRLGQAQDPKLAPGLYVKAPFIDNVIYIDKRILDLDSPAQEVIASDQQRLRVDAFARYRVIDPLKFYQTMNSVPAAEQRLTGLLDSALRGVLGQATSSDLIRDKRAILMGQIRDQLNTAVGRYGIEIVDVRIRRADFPDSNSEAVYQRMQTERQREAAQYRALGSEQAQRIRAQADRDVAKILGEANGSSSATRGDADAQRAAIFATAYNSDPDFFAFYRSLQAYQTSFKQGDTRFVLEPDSDFFRYFKNPAGTAPSPQAPAPATAPAP